MIFIFISKGFLVDVFANISLSCKINWHKII
jgi:hypothetical protein